MLHFSWRSLLGIYARSMLATIAAIMPVFAAYWFWGGPARIGFAEMFAAALAGATCWLVALRALGHPLYAEIAGILGEIATSARPMLVRLSRRST